MSESNKVPQVYVMMQNVQRDMLEGIAKNGINKEQKYKYRSLEDVVNAIAPLLVKHCLLLTPEVVKMDISSFTGRSGGIMHRAVVHTNYNVICTCDGSKHVISACGEGVDSSDKATNKANSFCYKYAITQAFNIPFADMSQLDGDKGEGYDDRDNKPAPAQATPPAQAKPASPQEVQAATIKRLTTWCDAVRTKAGMDHTKVEPGKYIDEWRDVIDPIGPIGKQIDRLKMPEGCGLTTEQAQGIAIQYFRYHWYLSKIAAAAGYIEELEAIQAMHGDEGILREDAWKKIGAILKAALNPTV